MSKHESTHQPILDNCAWCSRAIDAPDDAWRRMVSVEGLAYAANYCPPTSAERTAETDGLSRCRRTGMRNVYTVAARLEEWRKAYEAAEAVEAA